MASWQGLNNSFLLATEHIKIWPPFYCIHKLYEIKTVQDMINSTDKLYSLVIKMDVPCKNLVIPIISKDVYVKLN